MSAELKSLLLAGAKQMGVVVSDQQVDTLLAYVHLFEKWNKTYNLSAIRDIRQMVSRHLIDSLSIASHIHGERLIDVGTGGGLPGIPLAILYPQKHFTLLDSNGKKTRFLFQVKTTLQLHNVSIENARVEAFHPAECYDGVITRAFASLRDMTDGCQHLLNPGGVFLAMKGIYPQDELSALEKNYKVSDSFSLQVPDENGERHLLVLSPVG